jgi:hypothetical protein
MFAQVRLARDFEGLGDRMGHFIAAMGESGYEFELMDEDGESMIAYGVAFADRRSITAEAYWDEDEGASAACAFHDDGTVFVLAQSRVGGIVEVERTPSSGQITSSTSPSGTPGGDR